MIVLATLVLVAYALVIQDNPLSFLAFFLAALSRCFTFADTHIHLGACTHPAAIITLPPALFRLFFLHDFFHRIFEHRPPHRQKTVN